MTDILNEARRLYALGAAVHWLHPRSKRPVEAGWGSGPRKSLEHLESTYREGLNVGIRLGRPSEVPGKGFLAVIDVDVKSPDKRHRKEALEAVRALLGGAVCPEVRSGRGNGSRHYYCLTPEPFKTFNPAESLETVRVLQPSKSPSKRELLNLTPTEIEEGWRLSRAWEVSLYSDGRQVVIPPSIHPDTGRPYYWAVPFEALSDLTVLEFEHPKETASGGGRPGAVASTIVEDFEADETLDVRWLPGLSKEVREAIVKGTGVTDRSGYLLRAAHALLSTGLDSRGILTVLSDRSTFLGECAYEHARTDSRKRACKWLWDYTVKRVMSERDPVAAFSGVAVERGEVHEWAAEEQAAEIEEGVNWKTQIARTGKDGVGPPKNTLNNVEMILSNVVGEGVFERNLFAYRDAYGIDAPWGPKKGALVVDDDVPLIKSWLGKNWGFESSKDVLQDVVCLIAQNNAYDPARDWLDALPEWDKRPRLDTWLAKHFEGKGEPEYLAQVFRKWMVAMVMRVYSPGAKFDWMPIFEGQQGVGKSSFGRMLVGADRFLDWLPNLADKDSALALQGAWAVEMGELASMRKNELEIVKAYITRTVDKFRPPFGRRLIESPRRCVFYGTTNHETYLRDETGNRRFKPVMVGQLDFEALEQDREQLFAEAQFLYLNFHETETSLELSGVAREYEKRMHSDKTVADDSNVMKDQILDGLGLENLTIDFEKFRLLELFEGGGPLRNWRPEQRNVNFAAKALKDMGAETRWLHGRKIWKWPEKARKRYTPTPENFF